MSSRNRRNRGKQDDPLNVFDTQLEPESVALPIKPPTMREMDRKGYGSTSEIKVEQETVKSVPLNKIIPDPSQPRRAVPFAVRRVWDGNYETLFLTWEALIQEQENEGFNIHKMLKGGDEIRTTEPQPLEASLMKIIDLAMTIRRDGLANPITCVLHGADTFYLETGERRLLAYHLLMWATDEEKWKKIPVRRVEQWSVWRQASENNARDNLNAIGKARQFALLLMDLLSAEGVEFQPIHRFENEQDFYAQVADSEQYRIPDGKGEQVNAAMGVNNRVVTTRYRNLLKLPPIVWIIADDLNWTERKIRDLTTLSEEAAIRQALKWASQEGMLLPMGNSTFETESVAVKKQQASSEGTDISDFVLFLEKSKSNFERKIKKINRLQALEIIEQYEAWLKNIKQSLQQKK